ncbi:hypothetical protein [Microcystis aeruginosa]|uniref:hypothetical protein n=1 Tax=Microcystis aeruginosa TaxID=1126 RepID=UPI0013038A8D|nr:hypothetical protein [Microcystis aeruginosa]
MIRSQHSGDRRQETGDRDLGVLGFWGFSSISPLLHFPTSPLPHTPHPTPHTPHPTPHTPHPNPNKKFSLKALKQSLTLMC